MYWWYSASAYLFAICMSTGSFSSFAALAKCSSRRPWTVSLRLLALQKLIIFLWWLLAIPKCSTHVKELEQFRIFYRLDEASCFSFELKHTLLENTLIPLCFPWQWVGKKLSPLCFSGVSLEWQNLLLVDR